MVDVSKIKNKLVIVGDVHGYFAQYRELVRQYKYSLQVGDMGFTYFQMVVLNPDFHKFIPGNHDNYTILATGTVRHTLGDFGVWDVPGFGPIFFVRGAYSIDRKIKKPDPPKQTWWKEEELNEAESDAALALYMKINPDFVVTHEAPSIVVDQIGDPRILNSFDLPKDHRSSTQKLLQTMWEHHQPKTWIFGHHHQHYEGDFAVSGNSKDVTHFTCLDGFHIEDNPLMDFVEFDLHD